MSISGTIAAAFTLYFTGGNVAAASFAYSLGAAADGYLNAPNTEGPRLDDLKIPTSSYGVDIPDKYGTGRQAGNTIWQTPLIQHSHEHSSKGGPTNTTYSYTFHTAIGICTGPIKGIARIWANKKVVYDARASNVGAISDPMLGTMRVYLGDETQVADPLITAISGASPAYRGLAYIVLEDADGTETRGRIAWEFEVVASGTSNVGHNNICALTAADQGVAGLRGESWITERVIYIWRGTSGGIAAPLALFKSVDGGPAQYIMDVYISGAIGSNRVVPVNTRDILYMAYTYTRIDPNLDSGVTKEILQIFNPAAIDVSGTVRTIEIGPRSGYVTFSSDNMIVAYDQDSDVTACATRNLGNTIYSSALAIFHGGKAIYGGPPLNQVLGYDTSLRGTYTFRSAAMEVCCGIACADGKVFALIYSGTTLNTMDLVVLSQTDGSLINSFAGPVSNPVSLGTDATESIRTDGTSVWAYAPANGMVWKWAADGSYKILSGGGLGVGTQVTRDDGSSQTTLGGNQMFIGDNFFIAQGQSPALSSGPLQPIWRHQRVTYAALTSETVPLGDIVADICVKSGLSAGDIDVSALTDEVAGYDRPRVMTGSAALQPLQQGYFFDAVESDFKLKFVKRGGAIATTIPEDDRAAHEEGQALPDALKIVRLNELELPSLVDVDYIDGSADYLVGNQYERRLTKNVKSRIDLKLAINLNKDQAKRIAATTLYSSWLTQTYAWSTTRAYSQYEPTDVFYLPTANAIYAVRATKKTEHLNGVIDWEGIEEDATVYTQTGIGSAVAYVSAAIFVPDRSTLALMDIPILRDEDNDSGAYAKMVPIGSRWSGAELTKNDGGVPVSEGSVSKTSVIGTALTVLAPYDGIEAFDESGSVDVQLPYGTLTSATRDQVLSAVNIFLIGNGANQEIFGARNATLIATLRYRLSGLLRNLRCTYGTTHAIGDRIVLIEKAGMLRFNNGSSDIGIQHQYSATTFGRSFDTTEQQSFTNTARGLMPFPPAQLGGGRNSAGDVIFKWRRRTRLSSMLVIDASTPLGEASEAYDVDIFTNSTYAVVTRTFASLPTQDAIYTAAMQIADFGSLQSTVYWSVAQRSAVVGRGIAAKGQT